MKDVTVFATFFLGLFLGCASTRISSFTDPAYHSTKFKRIAVVAGVSNLDWRKRVESSFVAEFKREHLYAIEGMTLFPPTRSMSAEEMSSVLTENQIDAILYISVGDAGVSQQYVPPTTSTTRSSGTVSTYGNSSTYHAKTTTTTDPGYTLSKPWARFEAKLFDALNGQNAWVASASTGGNAFANFNTVIDSFSSETVEQLLQDGLLPRRPPFVFRDRVEDQTQLGDVLYLKNGSIIRGTILELIPDKTVKIQTSDGSIFVFQVSEVEKITKEGGVRQK